MWAHIARAFNPPAHCTTTSNLVKRAYEKALLPFYLAILRGEYNTPVPPETRFELTRAERLESNRLAAAWAAGGAPPVAYCVALRRAALRCVAHRGC